MSMMLTGLIDLDAPNEAELRGGQTGTFTEVTFPTPFPPNSHVIVIPMVQTFNGPDTPGVRIADVTTKGFRIRMNEVVVEGKALAPRSGTHTKETIAWLATTV